MAKPTSRNRHRSVSFITLLAVLLFSLLGPFVPGASTASLQSNDDSHMISPDAHLNADGSLNVDQDFYGSFDLSGFAVLLDDDLGPVFSPKSQPAAVAAATWEALAENGLNSTVNALAAIGTDLYVGGQFTQTDGGATTGLNRIAKYDTSTGSWSALADNGLNGTVYALAAIGTDLYVGGGFAQTNGGATTGLNYIAKYDTSTSSWSALTDDGLNDWVYALAAIGTDLYLGGPLYETYWGATTGLDYIAKYDTSTSTWSALADNGLNDEVESMAVIGTDLYVGGVFSQTAFGATTGLRRIAKYDTSTSSWSALADNGLDDVVRDLAVIGTDLYVGGGFTQTFGGATTGLNWIAKYDTSTSTWSALADNGLDNWVRALGAVGTDLYVGGQFTQTNGGVTTGLNRIAKYNTSTSSWSALTDNGLSNTVQVLAAIGTDLYVGGYFYQTNGGATTGLNRIAAYGAGGAAATATPTPTNTATNTPTNTSTATPIHRIHRFSIDNDGGRFNAGRILVVLPAGIIPSGYSNCRLDSHQEADSNIASGFTTGDAVYDISLQCSPSNLTDLTQPITVCLKPKDGITSDKQVFHQPSGGSYAALPLVSDNADYVCGSTSHLSNFTLGKKSIAATSTPAATLTSSATASATASGTALTATNTPTLTETLTATPAYLPDTGFANLEILDLGMLLQDEREATFFVELRNSGDISLISFAILEIQSAEGEELSSHELEFDSLPAGDTAIFTFNLPLRLSDGDYLLGISMIYGEGEFVYFRDFHLTIRDGQAISAQDADEAPLPPVVERLGQALRNLLIGNLVVRAGFIFLILALISFEIIIIRKLRYA